MVKTPGFSSWLNSIPSQYYQRETKRKGMRISKMITKRENGFLSSNSPRRIASIERFACGFNLIHAPLLRIKLWVAILVQQWQSFFWAISLSFKHGQNLYFWLFLRTQRSEKPAPTVLSRHIQFWALSFCICNLTQVSTLYWGRWRRIT